MKEHEIVEWIANAVGLSGLRYDGINNDMRNVEANVRFGQPVSDDVRVSDDSPQIGIYHVKGTGPVQGGDNSFFYRGIARGISGIRYLGFNQDLRMAGSNVLFGPSVMEGVPQPDSPMMGMYCYRDVDPRGMSLDDALSYVRKYKLEELLAQERASDEGMPSRRNI